MINAGFTLDNPLTGSHMILLEGNAETKGNGWLLETHCIPHAQPDIPEHFHLHWTETFEIVSGTAFYGLNGQVRTARAGETIGVMPRERHIHPWNAGETELIYRQMDRFRSPDSTAVEDVLGGFATLFGLAREGKVDKQGRPKNPLQLAVTLKLFNRHSTYDLSLPMKAQDMLAATLGTLAESLGYRAILPQYLATD